MGYSTLKAALDAVVRTNGNQQITGANLNGVMTTLLQGVDVMDRANPADTSGMNKVVLDKNLTFAEQVTGANTIYEIRDSFNLGGNAVTIPSGCVLLFEGGHVFNGTIHFAGCLLAGNWKDGQQCDADGELKNDVIYPEMFAPDNCPDWSVVINRILLDNDTLHLSDKDYTCLTSIIVEDSQKSIIGASTSLLSFYGTGDFVKIGKTTDYSRYIKLKNLSLRNAGSGLCSNLISILGASECEFVNIICRGGNLTTNGIGRPAGSYHFISSILVKCVCFDCENGIVLQYSHQSQVNNVTLIDCGVSRTEKSGLSINGNGILVLGGDYSNTGDHGILIDGYTRGLNICGVYCENNTRNAIYITNTDIENLTIENAYTYNNSVVCEIDKFVQTRKRINTGNGESKKYNFDTMNISSPGDSAEESFGEISATKLPCKVNLKFKTITNSSYLFTLLGIYLDGKAYQLNAECEVKKIVAKNGNTITLDSALSGNYSFRVNVLRSNPLARLVGDSVIQTLGVCLMTPDNYTYVGETYLPISVSGATTGAITLTINDQTLQVGDFIAFTNLQRGSRLNGSSISISAADTLYSQDQAMPAIASSLPVGMREKLCVMFYITNDIKNYEVDSLSAYTIS